MKPIALFKSHYSVGKSILTLREKDESKSSEPTSIVDLVFKNEESLGKKVCLVEDNMSGFLEAHINLTKIGAELVFGLRIEVCPNIEEKNEESIHKSSKYIIFIKRDEGYPRLIKLFSKGAKEGFYYKPRLDFETIRKEWDDDDLILAVPFYDSFLFNNCLRNGISLPNFDFTKPIFFSEDNDLPFDELLNNRLKNFTSKSQIQKTKSIYYENKSDFKAYLTARCINNRSTLNKPNLDHMCSNEFCFESWRDVQ